MPCCYFLISKCLIGRQFAWNPQEVQTSHGWKISDLKGISSLVCTHHIYMDEEAKLVRQPQRRLNPHMQEVVHPEVLKLL